MNRELVAELVPSIKEALRKADRLNDEDHVRAQRCDKIASKWRSSVALGFQGVAILLLGFFLNGWLSVGFVAFGAVSVATGSALAHAALREERRRS